MNPEIIEALRLVEEYDRQRPTPITEFRIYYDEEGRVTMYCETDHPNDTNYIVVDNPDVFFKTNTGRLRVINGELKIIDTRPTRTHLAKSTTGQPVVRGMAALALTPTEEYQDIEYYDRTTLN
jgi:hypothetical protein